jgi:alpha-tubulin suppressor-like RCC1 family protein
MIACGNHHNLVLNTSGVIFGWGNNDHYQIMPNLEKKESKEDIIRRPKKPL